jgi:hypothetical protein
LSHLTTVHDVIDALGGIEAVVKLTGRNAKAVYHWRALNTFPARYHDMMPKALKRLKHTAPPKLWNQIVIERSKKKAA